MKLAGGKPMCPRRQDLDSLLELQGITEGTLAAMGQCGGARGLVRV